MNRGIDITRSVHSKRHSQGSVCPRCTERSLLQMHLLKFFLYSPDQMTLLCRSCMRSFGHNNCPLLQILHHFSDCLISDDRRLFCVSTGMLQRVVVRNKRSFQSTSLLFCGSARDSVTLLSRSATHTAPGVFFCLGNDRNLPTLLPC